MENEQSIFKKTLMPGLVLGLALIALQLVIYLAGLTSNKSASYVTYPVLVALLAWGILQVRKANGGLMTYGQGVGAGTLIGLYSALLTSTFTVILFNVIDTTLVDQIIQAQQAEMLKNPQITDEIVEQATKWTRKMFQPPLLFGIGILSSTLMATIFSLIISIFTRKKDEIAF